MAEASEKTTAAGSAANKLEHQGDHDRVQMLSLKADGTPDQHNPEFISDKESSLEATAEQFRQQAVSAVDVAERGVSTDVGETVEQDPGIAELQEKHESAAKGAESAAKSAVESLTSSDDVTTPDAKRADNRPGENK